MNMFKAEYSKLKNNIDSYYDIDSAKNALYTDVINTIEILLRNGYIVSICETRDELIVLNYEYDNNLFNNDLSTKNPYWITKTEYNDILQRREEKREFQLKLP